MSRPSGDLQAQLEELLRDGAFYELAPNIGCDVLDRIDGFMSRHIAYPSEAARHTHVLWCGHCWLMDCWFTTPRLTFISPEAACGKTRALTVTRDLVPHPDHTADLSPASIYHSIETQMNINGGRPTILYDELDTVFGPGLRNEEMRRLLDSGHEQGGTVNRYMGPKRGMIKFPVYCAMALAGKMDILDLPQTIATRSVVIRMQRRAPDEVVERWDRRISPLEAEILRDLLQFWIEFVHGHAAEYRAELPEQIQDRDADCWEPLITVADLAGGHWPERARVAAVAAVAAAGSKATPSRGMQLLWDIKIVFDKLVVDVLSTAALLSELKTLEDSTWSGLTAMVMAKMLSAYGVEPRNQRIGEKVVKGYRRVYFGEAWRRYPSPATAATAATEAGETDES